MDSIDYYFFLVILSSSSHRSAPAGVVLGEVRAYSRLAPAPGGLRRAAGAPAGFWRRRRGGGEGRVRVTSRALAEISRSAGTALQRLKRGQPVGSSPRAPRSDSMRSDVGLNCEVHSGCFVTIVGVDTTGDYHKIHNLLRFCVRRWLRANEERWAPLIQNSATVGVPLLGHGCSLNADRFVKPVLSVHQRVIAGITAPALLWAQTSSTLLHNTGDTLNFRQATYQI